MTCPHCGAADPVQIRLFGSGLAAEVCGACAGLVVLCFDGELREPTPGELVRIHANPRRGLLEAVRDAVRAHAKGGAP